MLNLLRYWTWRSRSKGVRPAIDPEVRKLIKQMANAILWGAPRIHGELLKPGTAPRYLLRDRDGIYGDRFRHRIKHLGIKEVIPARRSPWQNPYAERVIGTLRRELLDHVIVVNERHLRRLLRRFVGESCHPCRTHLSLGKDAPEQRAVDPPEMRRRCWDGQAEAWEVDSRSSGML